MTPLERVLSLLPDHKRNGKGWKARCPAHEDRQASLSITEGEDGRALIYCHARCDFDDVLACLGLKASDVMPPKPEPRSARKALKIYAYLDEAGTLLYEVVRYEPKDFRQRRPDGKGGYIWNLDGVRRIPYRLPEMIASSKTETVFIVEGEKDADRLAGLGFIATTCPQGAGKWGKLDPKSMRHFQGRRVVVLPDNDEPGRTHAAQVAHSLHGTAAELKLVQLEGLPSKGDVSDWLNAGKTTEDLKAALDAAPAWTPQRAPAQPAVPVQQPASPDALPKKAYHGLAGEIVQLIDPHTEADPAALLLQTLVAFGNAAGRNAFFRADGADHFPNLFVVLIGATAKGRKGTSWSHVHRLFSVVDQDWATDRIPSGLSSGEGLIWAVRDPVYRTEAVKEKGKYTGESIQVMSDAGVTDKRLLAMESEFASVLRVLQRDGNSLSAIVRQAWDTGTLRTLTKNSPATATDSHISIVGHITSEELRRYLDRTEQANGFANRFLWACVKRSKCLPEGGQIDEVDFSDALRRLAQALEFAKQCRQLDFDNRAKATWHQVYPQLSEGQPGLTGAMLSRAEAQVVRLAMIYALLDCSDEIRLEHLHAALAIWDYCEASVKHVFGDATGDDVTDEILRALRNAPEGLTRTQISALFGRHQSASRINTALNRLMGLGLAYMTSNDTGGRSEERWFARANGGTDAKEAK
jgi:5S rRNA maturation endonuclease (ribonuclease M5)